jgi:transcriptional regulator with XRE-family HTH domain
MGYTQRQIAKLLGLHDTVPISQWERGVKLPNTLNLIKLCVLYRTLPTDLYPELFQEFQELLSIRELENFKKI